jgi:hypothetical protein
VKTGSTIDELLIESAMTPNVWAACVEKEKFE